MFEKPAAMNRFLKVALWGAFKVGKSSFALGFPKPCVIDGERGTLLFDKQYDFEVSDANHWEEMLEAIGYLEKNPGKYETLVIDPVTVFWQDLVDSYTEYVRNKRNHEILTHGDWGIIKRRWKGFMNRLIDLDMHVVLVMRAKDEYRSSKDDSGKEVSIRTGDHVMDAEKSTAYIFDVILRLEASRNARAKKTLHTVRVEGSRHAALQKDQVFEITDKKGFDVLFGKWFKELKKSDKPNPKRKSPEKLEEEKEQAKPDHLKRPNETQMVGEVMDRFVAAPHGPDGQSGVPATADDIKVLMTRANALKWPDGSRFSSADGKALVKSVYRVESTRDLMKHQVDFLYEEFGKVASGRAYLDRDREGNPFVATI